MMLAGTLVAQQRRQHDYTIDDTAQIHPAAHVDRDTCVIGARTRVWQFATVIRSAVIGDDCSIASCAIVDGSDIGDRCIVSHGAFIDPGIEIGNDVFIGPHVSMCNDAWPRTDKNGFSIEELISGDFVTTRIEDGASVGANVVVLPGIVIGAGAMIAAGAVVAQDVPAAHLYKRDGSMTIIRLSGRKPRMRRAGG